jgi:uncharacterized glyoxalase superfamily protein PhnB
MLVAEWFRDVLGFDVDDARVFTLDPAEGASYAIVERDGMEVHLQIRRVEPGPRDPNAYECYARVPDAGALLDEVTARGANVVQPLERQPYGMVDFSVASPEGHVLMFGSPAE